MRYDFEFFNQILNRVNVSSVNFLHISNLTTALHFLNARLPYIREPIGEYWMLSSIQPHSLMTIYSSLHKIYFSVNMEIAFKLVRVTLYDVRQ